MEKLSALGELASGVAHDFNNTLSGILGRAQLLQRTDDPEKLKRGLDIIIKTAEDGAKTVKRIQDFARQRRDHDFELVSVDPDPVGRKRDHAPVEELRRGIKHSHHAQSANRLEWDGDGRRLGLREVLVNMVFNAIDAMPEGGTLSLMHAPRRFGADPGCRYRRGNVSRSALTHLRSILTIRAKPGWAWVWR